VGANAGELRALASMLRESRPLYAAGIAAATELVSDGTGPMYRADPAALAHALELARAAMGGSEPPPPGTGPIVFPPSPRPAAPRPSSTAFGRSSRLTRGGWVHGRREGA
jgi:hypothetical protein